MISRPITQKDYDLILKLDKRVYPTNTPVTREVIASWYIRNPEFGSIFEEGGKIKGISIMLPLNKKSWEKLIKGELTESEMTSSMIFDNSKDKELGIHVYHIEKLDKSIKKFYKLDLEETKKIIERLREYNPLLKVCGYSALGVTGEGINLAKNITNLKERSFVSDEHILEKNKKLVVAENVKQAEELEQKGYNYLNRCQMLVTYPNEASIVWNYLNKI